MRLTRPFPASDIVIPFPNRAVKATQVLKEAAKLAKSKPFQKGTKKGT